MQSDVTGILASECKQVYFEGLRGHVLMDMYNLLNGIILSLYLAWFVTRFIVWQKVNAAESATGATIAAQCLLEHSRYSEFDALLRAFGVLEGQRYSYATPTPNSAAYLSTSASASAAPVIGSDSSFPISARTRGAASWLSSFSSTSAPSSVSGSPGFWDSPMNESDALSGAGPVGLWSSSTRGPPPLPGGLGLGDTMSSSCLRKLRVEPVQMPLSQEQQTKIYFLAACVFSLIVIFIFCILISEASLAQNEGCENPKANLTKMKQNCLHAE